MCACSSSGGSRLSRRDLLAGLAVTTGLQGVIGGKAFAKPCPTEYSDREFGVLANGHQDDSEAYLAMADRIPDGKTLRFEGPGIRILRKPVRFPQERFNVICDAGVTLKKGSNTPEIDTLVEFSGDYLHLTGGCFDANVAGNPVHSGRAETLRISGDYARLLGLLVVGCQPEAVMGLSTALYVTGRYGVFENIESRDTLSNAIRDHGDFNTYRDLRMFEFARHGFVKDSGYRGAPSTYTLIENVCAVSSLAQDAEAILFDHHEVQGAACRVVDVLIDTPANTGPDKIKFAYMNRVEIERLTVLGHPGERANQSCSLRFQQAVSNVTLRDVVLAGHINFDATHACDLWIGGRSVIGKEVPSAGAIQDFWGRLVVEDGVEFRRNLEYVLSLSSRPEAWNSRIRFGSCVFHAEPDRNAIVTRLPPLSGMAGGQERLIPAGLVSIARPVAMLGGMRSLEEDGRWVCENDLFELAVEQGGDRLFLASAQNFPPSAGTGWKRGDRIRMRTSEAVSAASKFEFLCVRSGTASETRWKPDIIYEEGTIVHDDGEVYLCRSSGASGWVSPGSSREGGGACWEHIDRRADFSMVRFRQVPT